MKTFSEMSDPQRDEILRNAERRRRRQLSDDMRRLMSEEWGRRLAVWLVYDLCALEELSFNEYNSGIKHGQTAAMHMAMNEGRRMAGHDLRRQIQSLALPQWSMAAAERIREQQAELALLQDIQSASEDSDGRE